MVQGALRFLLNDARIATALVGFSSEAQIEEAVAGEEIGRLIRRYGPPA